MKKTQSYTTCLGLGFVLSFIFTGQVQLAPRTTSQTRHQMVGTATTTQAQGTNLGSVIFIVAITSLPLSLSLWYESWLHAGRVVGVAVHVVEFRSVSSDQALQGMTGVLVNMSQAFGFRCPVWLWSRLVLAQCRFENGQVRPHFDVDAESNVVRGHTVWSVVCCEPHRALVASHLPVREVSCSDRAPLACCYLYNL